MKALVSNIILCAVALILGVILIPIGVIYAIFRISLTKKIKEAIRFTSQLFLSIAISIDQLGNTGCKYLFNDILIKNDSLEFGCVDETISSVLGKNKKTNNLTIIGLGLDNILNIFEPNHSIKSIENNGTK